MDDIAAPVNDMVSIEEAPRGRVGRPSVREAEEKQKALLEAALEEFSRHGFHGASVRAIARRAGLSTRTLYNHYADKVALFAACLELSANQDSWVLPQTGGTLHEELVNFATHMQERLHQERQVRLSRVIFRECTSFPELEAVSRSQFERHQLAPVQVLLERHGFGAAAAREYAAVYVAMAFQRWQNRAIYDEPAPSHAEIAHHAEMVTALFLDGASALRERGA